MIRGRPLARRGVHLSSGPFNSEVQRGDFWRGRKPHEEFGTSIFLGRELSLSSILWISVSDPIERSEPFGKYCLNRPLVCSQCDWVSAPASGPVLGEVLEPLSISQVHKSPQRVAYRKLEDRVSSTSVAKHRAGAFWDGQGEKSCKSPSRDCAVSRRDRAVVSRPGMRRTIARLPDRPSAPAQPADLRAEGDNQHINVARLPELLRKRGQERGSHAARTGIGSAPIQRGDHGCGAGSSLPGSVTVERPPTP
jgi:hypothetical protein